MQLLVISDDDKVHSHRDAARLDEEHATDLIDARPALLCICVDVYTVVGGCRDVYSEDGGHLFVDPLCRS
ncbi:hypothetical protein B296_00036956 [Ensete ventricosum]|uniref:Uncharacterized protein n=1 Tax=Ensete ventricosum TaxID=4639 RepID=A0A426ZK31_ENSVE|nr:hypothetical protein B296_00036956 [Ensete ventricosum]